MQLNVGITHASDWKSAFKILVFRIYIYIYIYIYIDLYLNTAYEAHYVYFTKRLVIIYMHK